MVTEDYVSFETAKLLKENGFDEKTLSYYEDNVICHGDWFEWNRSPLGHISAPTLQMTRKWLREVHEIILDTAPNLDGDCNVYNGFCCLIYKNGLLITALNDEEYTYEEACEAAIKYCLENLI